MSPWQKPFLLPSQPRLPKHPSHLVSLLPRRGGGRVSTREPTPGPALLTAPPCLLGAGHPSPQPLPEGLRPLSASCLALGAAVGRAPPAPLPCRERQRPPARAQRSPLPPPSEGKVCVRASAGGPEIKAREAEPAGAAAEGARV